MIINQTAEIATLIQILRWNFLFFFIWRVMAEEKATKVSPVKPLPTPPGAKRTQIYAIFASSKICSKPRVIAYDWLCSSTACR